MLGKNQDKVTAHRDEQLFSIGEERAIVEYAGTMADVGFPLTSDMLRQIAQGLINERETSQRSQGGRQRQGVIPSSSSNPIHTIGIHWVTRFLDRNPGFKKVYIRYQERARAAATNDTELQADFLWKLANLVRRKKIAQCDI